MIGAFIYTLLSHTRDCVRGVYVAYLPLFVMF